MKKFSQYEQGTGGLSPLADMRIRLTKAEAEIKRLREALDNIADGIIPGIDYDSTGEPLSSLMSGYARHVLKEDQ